MGEIKWTIPIRDYFCQSAAIDGDLVLLTDEKVQAIEYKTGKIIWSKELGRVNSSPLTLPRSLGFAIRVGEHVTYGVISSHPVSRHYGKGDYAGPPVPGACFCVPALSTIIRAFRRYKKHRPRFKKTLPAIF